MEDTIQVSITNYDEFKGRSDVKHNSWFRLSNRFLEDSDFFDFTSDEKLCWIYILSLSSQKNSGTVLIKFKHADKICGFKKNILMSAIKKLSDINCLSIDVTDTLRGRYADVTDTCATDKQTDITDRQHNAGLDFEFAYNLYPLKKGKSKAISKLKKDIKTQIDFEHLIKAIYNYKQDTIKNRTEEKFIKHFSTFANEWRDWVDYVLEKPAIGAKKQKEETFAHIETFEYNDEARLKAIEEAKQSNLLKITIDKIKEIK